MPYQRAVKASYLLNFLEGLSLYEARATTRLSERFLDVLAENLKEFPIQDDERNDYDNGDDNVERIDHRVSRRND